MSLVCPTKCQQRFAHDRLISEAIIERKCYKIAQMQKCPWDFKSWTTLVLQSKVWNAVRASWKRSGELHGVWGQFKGFAADSIMMISIFKFAEDLGWEGWMVDVMILIFMELSEQLLMGVSSQV